MLNDDDRAPSITRLADDECRVVPRSEDKTRFGCGHDAPARYAMIVRTGHEEMELIIEDGDPRFLEKCGDCRRAEVVKTATRCRSCRTIILVGSLVAEDRSGSVRCLGDGCAGPFGLSGTWKGAQVEPARFATFGPMH